MKKHTPTKAVIYCRVSSIKQAKVGDGLHSQETRCREYARMKGYEVVEVFHDDVSGSMQDRRAMKAMLAFLKRHRKERHAVLIDDISRLARGVKAHIELRAAIDLAGGVLESPTVEFGEDADSELQEYILATVAQHQRRKNAEQTKNRMRARVMNGYWVFQAPVGYKYQRVTGRGQMLVPDEPAASIVREALEGYASGRFERPAEVMRFLQDNPLFPKDSTGTVRHQRVHILLNQPVYAGYIEAPKWDVSLRPGQHEPLISFQTYQRIQDRLGGGFYAPRKRNVNEDFPLRGFVVCADCETPLTACWSKGAHSRHPYYLCPKRGCDSYGKSIRRADIEGQFETLLHALTPSEKLFGIATKMLKRLWDHQQSQGAAMGKALAAELIKIEKQVATLLERILDASVPSVIGAYENRIQKLEEEKLLIRERMAETKRPARDFDKTVRTALGFLASPWNLWRSDRLEDKRAVLKLAFAKRLQYRRGEGFRTADLSLPFKMLDKISGDDLEMARPKGFEPLTPRFVVWCSIQLSYGRAAGRMGDPDQGGGSAAPSRAAFPSHSPRELQAAASHFFVQASWRLGCAHAGRRRAVRACARSSGRSGMVMAKAVCPPRLSTSSIVPPWARTSSCAMASPSPVPPLRAEPRKAENRLSRAFCGRPGPVSSTRMRATPPSRPAPMARRRTSADSRSSAIACTALRARLDNTRNNWSGSASTSKSAATALTNSMRDDSSAVNGA